MTTDKIDFYRKCVIKKLLKLKINGCNIEYDSACSNCDKDVLYLNAILNQFEYCINHELLEEAKHFETLLEKRCGNCSACP